MDTLIANVARDNEASEESTKSLQAQRAEVSITELHTEDLARIGGGCFVLFID